jgi:hypothetical protein
LDDRTVQCGALAPDALQALIDAARLDGFLRDGMALQVAAALGVDDVGVGSSWTARELRAAGRRSGGRERASTRERSVQAARRRELN